MPTRVETFGLVALEAMACETPVVAYPAGWSGGCDSGRPDRDDGTRNRQRAGAGSDVGLDVETSSRTNCDGNSRPAARGRKVLRFPVGSPLHRVISRVIRGLFRECCQAAVDRDLLFVRICFVPVFVEEWQINLRFYRLL